ncbi:MAG: bacteriorhodopsin [Spirosomataceae bacterium]|jgi:bacteriorhodopsin
MLNLLTILLNILFQQDVAMADMMRQDGKIWVVVGVILIVFTGIILFLISLDKKVTKLEKNNK